jgi:hypothetical protein
MSKMKLYEILVPTMYGDTMRPVGLRHHKEWDKFVHKLAGGLTLLRPVKGQWLEITTKDLMIERMIPVRIATTESNMNKIIDFTIKHYRQKAVMTYELSSNVIIRSADES